MRREGKYFLKHKKVKWKKGSAEKIFLKNKSIDVITSASSFHWYDKKKCLKEFARILKKDGYLILAWNPRVTKLSTPEKKIEKMLKGKYNIKNRISSGKKINKKVLIKAHPNFYEPSYGISSFWDKIIYSKVIKKFKKNKNFYFIDKPLFNFKLLNKISKNCVLVTHHGTVLFEGASFGFKTICSKATFFDKKFKVSNFWSNKSEYEKLLNLNQNRLNSSSKNDLLFLFYKTFIDDFSCFGKKVWENIIAKEVGINAKKFYAKIKDFSRMGKIQESQKYLNKVVGKKEDKIILKISKNIKII